MESLASLGVDSLPWEEDFGEASRVVVEANGSVEEDQYFEARVGRASTRIGALDACISWDLRDESGAGLSAAGST